MPADPVLSRELKSLQDEIAAAQRERQSPLLSSPADSGNAVPVSDPASEEPAEERELHEQLSDFVDQVMQFFEEAQKNISAHPMESVAGALIVGILIGRLIGPR